jgi:hypothetical protein
MRSERPPTPGMRPMEMLVTASQSIVQRGELSVRSVAVSCGETFPLALLTTQPKERGGFNGMTNGSLSTLSQTTRVLGRRVSDMGHRSRIHPQSGLRQQDVVSCDFLRSRTELRGGSKECCLLVRLAPTEPFDQGRVHGVAHAIVAIRRQLFDDGPVSCREFRVAQPMLHVEAREIAHHNMKEQFLAGLGWFCERVLVVRPKLRESFQKPGKRLVGVESGQPLCSTYLRGEDVRLRQCVSQTPE